MLCDLQIAIEDKAKLVGRLRMEIIAAEEIIRDWMCRGPFWCVKGILKLLELLKYILIEY
jgi:hypothetical protein